MALISFTNVTKYYENDMILDHISFQVNKNEKVALIGDNGAGKTTIFKLILKEIEPSLVTKEDKPGEISIIKDINIGYLDQNAIKNINNTVLEELEEPFLELKKLEDEFKKISELYALNSNDQKISDKYNQMLEKVESSRVFSYKNEIETLVSKFSFPLTILNKQVKFLSGGERMKIAFIKLLLFKYDVLLLDEPTNHLDISTIEWLEEYLKSYPGTIIFISHDRYFIEAIASKIMELEGHHLTIYNTTYENYLAEKERNYQHLLEVSKREEEEMAKLKKFIEFYMPKPRFASRAKDRVKKLERLEKNHVIQPKKENHNIKIVLKGGNLKNKELIEVKNLVVGYDCPLLNEINFSLYGKDKLAIIGDNGIGKTTLIKTILKEIPPLKGEIKEKRKINYGYIKQNDYSFKKGETILSHLRNIYPTKTERELRGALGRFLFKSDEVYKEVSLLSNGEKMRVNLCALMLSSYDILILDEPTNHLDLVTKECLISGLKEYEGAIIFISHDRYFINQVADFVLALSKDKVLYLEGNYDDLKTEIEEESKEFIKYQNDEKIIKENKNSSLIFDKDKKKQSLSKNKIQELEKRMAEIERDIETINTLLEEDFSDYRKIEELSDKKDELEKEYLEILKTLDA